MAAQSERKFFMGLDMHASTTNRHLTSSVDLSCGDADQVIHQWRKHPNLHGEMEDLQRRKRGSREFSCKTVQLTIEKMTKRKAYNEEGMSFDEGDRAVALVRFPFRPAAFFFASNAEIRSSRGTRNMLVKSPWYSTIER